MHIGFLMILFPLCDALRDVILPWATPLYMSDLREFLRGDYVETIERHYPNQLFVIKEGWRISCMATFCRTQTH